MTDTDRAHVRLAELVAALSLGIDLGFGQPMEHVLRQCLIALRLAERMGLDEQTRANVYYTALLVNVGCHSDAHEQAKWFGDDIALKSGKYDYEMRSVRGMAAGMKLLGSNHPPLHRFRVGLEFALSGHREVDDMISHHAAIARSLGEQLELPVDVLDALGSAYEMWDGRGWPGKLSGEEVPVASRVAMLAEYVEVAHRVGGVVAARELARKRAGKQFDPAFAQVMYRDAEVILSGLDAVATWDAVISAEPALAIVLSGRTFRRRAGRDRELRGSEDPVHAGPCAGASPSLRRPRAEQLGLSETEVRTLRRAGLVHDLGRLGVSNSIWDKPGPLGAGEWERVRFHPYITERMLHQSEVLAPLGAIAVQHRERLDGSGYPRGCRDRRSRSRRGCWARRTPIRRCASHDRTAAPSRRPMPPRSCAPKSGRAAWTPTRSKRFWARPATGCPVVARVPPG